MERGKKVCTVRHGKEKATQKNTRRAFERSIDHTYLAMFLDSYATKVLSLSSASPHIPHARESAASSPSIAHGASLTLPQQHGRHRQQHRKPTDFWESNPWLGCFSVEAASSRG